jgi:hypothetical protein
MSMDKVLRERANERLDRILANATIALRNLAGTDMTGEELARLVSGFKCDGLREEVTRRMAFSEGARILENLRDENATP